MIARAFGAEHRLPVHRPDEPRRRLLSLRPVALRVRVAVHGLPGGDPRRPHAGAGGIGGVAVDSALARPPREAGVRQVVLAGVATLERLGDAHRRRPRASDARLALSHRGRRHRQLPALGRRHRDHLHRHLGRGRAWACSASRWTGASTGSAAATASRPPCSRRATSGCSRSSSTPTPTTSGPTCSPNAAAAPFASPRARGSPCPTVAPTGGSWPCRRCRRRRGS